MGETAGATPRVLYCRCAYAQVVPGDVKDAVLDGLARSSVAFEMVPDLCEMAARRDGQLADIARAVDPTRPLHIVACWPRAVRGLFQLADARLPDAGVEILNMRAETACDLLARVGLDVGSGTGATPPEAPA
jgi:hypothetical protein